MNVGVLREAALLPVLVLLIIVGTVVSPVFLTVTNIAGIGQQISALGVVVVGESLILLIGGMDLSLESTFGLAPMIAAWLILPVSAFGSGAQISPYLGLLVLLAVGAAVGIVNGVLIVKGRLNGHSVPAGQRAAAQRAGIGYIPEDRRAEGFVAHLGVAENVTMAITGRLADRLGLLRPAKRAAAAAPVTTALSLVSSGPGQPVSELSGGNQQKVTVARTLAHEPGLIVAITPTRGVDVASKALLLESLAGVATRDGAGVLLCSDELSDLVICDRVIVLVRGEVFTEFTEPPFDRDQLIVATEGIAANGTAEEAAQ